MSKSHNFVSNSSEYTNGHQKNATTGTRGTGMASNTEFSRRSFLTTGTAASAGLLLDQTAGAQASKNVGRDTVKEYDVPTNGISLHVTEQGDGPAILFCHGFPDTSYTWRRQMQAVASAGYRALAPDMRGYGRSSAPADAALYTPLQTVGDLVGLLDSLHIPSAVIVGHDWRASLGVPR
jgi:alpha/beta hydrolase fold